MKTIGREDLKEKIDRGDDFVLLEVLSEQSYNREHLPGAIRFQAGPLSPTFCPTRTLEVVAYCFELQLTLLDAGRP